MSLKQAFHYIQERYYRIRYNVFINNIKHDNTLPTIKNTLETVQSITVNHTSLARFGDGEFVWIQQKSYGSFQQNSKELSERLIEVLNSNDSKLMIGIPRVFYGLSNFSLDARLYWERELVKEGSAWIRMIPQERVFFDTQATRPYMDVLNKNNSKKVFELFKQVWLNRQVIIVEGKETRFGVGNDLLDGARNICRIECPEVDAFEVYSRILQETLDVVRPVDNAIVLVALGPTATVLAYDLQTKFNIQTIDVGHLDVEYTWMKNEAQRKIGITGKYVNEAITGDNFQGEFEENILRKYKEQVVRVIQVERE